MANTDYTYDEVLAGKGQFKKDTSHVSMSVKRMQMKLYRPAMYLSSRNFAWDTRHIFLVVSHNGVNDGNHLPAGMAHGCHVGLPFIPFFLEIKLQRRIVKHRR